MRIQRVDMAALDELPGVAAEYREAVARVEVLRRKREALIVEAYVAGAPWRWIGHALGYTDADGIPHSVILRALQRAGIARTRTRGAPAVTHVPDRIPVC